MVKNRITHIVKRSGKRVLFNENKIVEVIWRAMQSVGEGKRADAERVAERVVELLNKDFRKEIPSVEDVQDRVESALMDLQFGAVAKSYILYRNERAKLREQKAALMGGQIDDLKLSINSVRLLEQRYLARDDEGEIAETPTQLFLRIARTVAMAEVNHNGDPKPWARKFFRMMSTLEFLPSSPVLMNAGMKKKQLASSFVIPVPDDLQGIFRSLEQAVIVQQAGGGTGFSFSRIRHRGDIVDSIPGVASGPIAYMRVYEKAMQAVKQGGHRQGANMAVLRVDHPDILDFINLKLNRDAMQNFNLSVGVTDGFMETLQQDGEYELINPRTGEPAGQLSARVVFDTLLAVSWRTGDPGLLFLDRINKDNACSHKGAIEATNPCAEQPMLPYESCCEGSINLTRFVKDGKIDWGRLSDAIRLSVRFLDDVIDVNHYPVPEIEQMTRGTRRIGLGIMGFADLLLLLGIPYASEDAVMLADEIGAFVRKNAEEASEELAEQRGTYPYWRRSRHEQESKRVRNSALLGIAPTGSISIIADCSGGIEPNYAFAYTRAVSGGSDLLMMNPAFKKVMRAHAIPEEIAKKIAKRGYATDEDDLPQELKDILLTAQQVPPEWHIRIQAAWQKHVDSGISKTINFPATASIKDIEEGMLLAWRLGCKGITVYRDNSLDVQVLRTGA